MSKAFARQDGHRHIKLHKQKTKISWRKPKGRHSKMRKRRDSYPCIVTVGHCTPRSQSGKIQGLKPILVHNLNELKLLDKNSIMIIAKIGAKKKLEIIKEAEVRKIKVLNLGGQK
jgi:large subunit ribosomal protein L32e